MIDQITPLILTYNEAPNIRRTLERLEWAREIVVVDSGSTDETKSIAGEFVRVRLSHRVFDTHTAQWNFGLDQVKTGWVLTLDADYVLTKELIAELANWQPDETLSAAYARFRFCVQGHSLRGTLYPPRAVLFRINRCRYIQDGHTQQLKIDGRTDFLKNVIEHDDRKPLNRWLWAQDRYALLEVEKLLAADITELPFVDRIRRKIIFAPLLVFFYTLIVQRLILDGWPGWFYVWQRTLAEMILSLRLTEQKLLRRK